MRNALQRHDAILRFEIERRRGYIFKTIGDAFCAAFWSIEEALEAAIDAQLRLAREDFHAVGGIAVRMAIHAGVTDERSGDYFGSAVNRTARLLSAGHGGQILISGFAADLAKQDLPRGIALRNLGTVPLRDLKEPEQVYQPIAPELRSDFKPLRALATMPNNLPRQTTSLVGRHDDVARVEALLTGVPLVTIVGAGGIGKTRLALEVAASRLNDEPDGVWFVNLSSIMSPALVAGAMLSSLGAERSTDADPLDALLTFLQKRQLLLLLDNSEHLISEVGSIVAQVLARCPLVTVLATSRAPLDLTGERIYRLGSLDLESAVRLFEDRASAVNPSFRSEPKRAVVETICRRLDGIALAIELAAARLRSMAIENLASHLELRLLTGGRDRRARQQTMRSLIDWSYDLLAQEEQRALRRCGVFVQGFNLGVAAIVCANHGTDDWQALELLTSLVDKSLVIAESHDRDQRYRLLEPIREYAVEKLADAGEVRESMRRHAEAFAALARAGYDEWERGPENDWLDRMEQDLPNFRAALDWTITEAHARELGATLVADLTPVFLRLALLTEGIEWCERTLNGSVALSAAVEARLRYGLSMLYSNIGANNKVLEQAEKAAELYRSTGDSRGLSRALSQVAAREAFDSRYERAKAAAEVALRLARESGDRRLIGDTLRRCASAFADAGESRVRELYAESAELFRSLDRDDETALALVWWGQWEAEAGEFTAAVARFLEAKELNASEISMMYLASNIASCYLALEEPASARTYALETLSLATKARHAVLVPMAISYLAMASVDADAAYVARLAGYAEERLRAAEWRRIAYEQPILTLLFDSLKRDLTEAELTRLLQEGARWSEEEAIAQATSR